ncbi:MAG: hypothetical protein KAU20_07775 [Nanoarchaeota archaeon]|nr:hypothetical protein [Nanoarchaeota archaeon]
MKRIIIAILTLAILLLLIGCEDNKADDIPAELKCEKDADCVAASCCHPDSCVNVNFKQDCERVMCTMECKPGTMDCGQGRCVCENNKCVAKIE